MTYMPNHRYDELTNENFNTEMMNPYGFGKEFYEYAKEFERAMMCVNNIAKGMEPNMKTNFEVHKIIFNYPATIVIWKDGTKTVVKCSENDFFDREKGVALCFMKKALGNKGSYYNVMKDWKVVCDDPFDI